MNRLFLSTLVLFFALNNAVVAGNNDKQIGSTLNKKFSVELSEVPEQVKAVIKAERPEFKMLEAQKELKHGNTYFDIEGLDENGNEIEFDMLLDNGTWRIAEIQRDITLAQAPEAVAGLYNEKIGVAPARIIESDQGDGVIIYEFYTVKGDKEKKSEIKLSVELLTEEWKH